MYILRYTIATLAVLNNGSILCRYCVGRVHNMLPWHFKIMGARCVGSVYEG